MNQNVPQFVVPSKDHVADIKGESIDATSQYACSLFILFMHKLTHSLSLSVSEAVRFTFHSRSQTHIVSLFLSLSHSKIYNSP